jgi:hypothetical protein
MLFRLVAWKDSKHKNNTDRKLCVLLN